MKIRHRSMSYKSIPLVIMFVLIAIFLGIVMVVRSIFISETVARIDLEFIPTKHTNQKSDLVHICFITSQFTSDNTATDKLFEVNKTVPRMSQSSYFHFYAFSNLKDLNALGWDIVVKDLGQYSRWITQSRWPKFQAYKEKTILKTCQVVFYVDGIISPKDVPKDFQAEAQRILKSSVQFAQRLHPDGGGAEAEFGRIKRQKKDINKNIKASLRWLESQQDYDKNCTLYENNMIGYSIHSQAFQQAADFFWDHYSKEEDSWRGKPLQEDFRCPKLNLSQLFCRVVDQPLWCYTLDHFNTRPLQLTGNGKGALFTKSLRRMRKGGHRYKSEESALATIPNQTEDPSKTDLTLSPCWLSTNVSEKIDDHQLKCLDEFQQGMAPQTRTHLGLTIAMPYYASPAMLLQQLANFASYPIEIQKQMSIIIVDDGSPPGLQAKEYIQNVSASNFHFRLQIARITTNIEWNVEGSRNLAFYLADTRRGLMLDLDMLVPVETVHDALQWNLTAPSSKESNTTQIGIAHKFNRKMPNGKYSVHPSLALLDVNEYWNAGGLDEDFAGKYGFGTEPHFWFMWKKGQRVVEKHENTFLIELDTEPCNVEWLQNSKLVGQCIAAIATLPSLNRNKKPNRRLWKKKSTGITPRSSTYLRFFWTMDMR
jgi:hypothetical protein